MKKLLTGVALFTSFLTYAESDLLIDLACTYSCETIIQEDANPSGMAHYEVEGDISFMGVSASEAKSLEANLCGRLVGNLNPDGKEYIASSGYGNNDCYYFKH